MIDQSNTQPRFTKAELLARMQHARLALQETLYSLTEQQLSRPGPDGWSVKDHLAHIAAWELGIAELLQRRDRFAAMGVLMPDPQGRGVDEINEQIFRQNAGLSSAEALHKFESAHQQMLQALDDLSDEDLYKPYASYLPEGSQGRQEPVLEWIAGNTYEHYEEHNEWIEDLLAGID